MTSTCTVYIGHVAATYMYMYCTGSLLGGGKVPGTTPFGGSPVITHTVCRHVGELKAHSHTREAQYLFGGGTHVGLSLDCMAIEMAW